MEPRFDAVLAGRAVPTSAALYRRSHIQHLRWDPNIPRLDDWDWFVQASLLMGKIVPANHVSYSWRHHDSQYSAGSSLLQYAIDHHCVLGKIESFLRENGELTTARKRRLAQYYYKELRVLCVHDRNAFEKAAAHILDLDPQFAPRDEERQPLMRFLGRLIGFRAAVLLHTKVKRMVKGAAS
jgi:hypothetical protein